MLSSGEAAGRPQPGRPAIDGVTEAPELMVLLPTGSSRCAILHGASRNRSS
jgi:hypothetical protein